MGYSISVRFANTAERDAMREFLLAQGVHAFMEATANFDTALVDGEDLAYPPRGDGARLLGFNATQLPFSSWAVCAWMARKSAFRSNHQAVLYHDDARYEVVGEGEATLGRNDVLVDTDSVMLVREPRGVLQGLGRLLGPSQHKKQAQAWVRSLDAKWLAWNQQQPGDAAPRALHRPR